MKIRHLLPRDAATRRLSFLSMTAAVAIVLVASAVFWAGCGKEGESITTPEVSTEPTANAPAAAANIDAVIDQEAEVFDAAQPSGRGSATVTGSYTARGVAGQVLWTYYHRVNWTYNGLQVTAVTYDDNGYASVQSPLWTYEGFVAKDVHYLPLGRLPCLEYTSKVTACFARHAYPGGPIIERKYPWVRDCAYGTGRGGWQYGM